MTKKYYSTKVVGIGGEAEKFSTLAKMIVIFDDSMVLPELREFSILHSGNKLTDEIKAGDILKVADSEFKILKVGGEVNNNIKSLGHIVIKFNDEFTSRTNPFRKFVSATKLRLSRRRQRHSAARRLRLSATIKLCAQQSR